MKNKILICTLSLLLLASLGLGGFTYYKNTKEIKKLEKEITKKDDNTIKYNNNHGNKYFKKRVEIDKNFRKETSNRAVETVGDGYMISPQETYYFSANCESGTSERDVAEVKLGTDLPYGEYNVENIFVTEQKENDNYKEIEYNVMLSEKKLTKEEAQKGSYLGNYVKEYFFNNDNRLEQVAVGGPLESLAITKNYQYMYILIKGNASTCITDDDELFTTDYLQFTKSND